MPQVSTNDATHDFWLHPISQPYIPGKHSGIDFAYAGVPEPGGEVRFPFSGHVIAARHDATGGTVMAAIDGTNYTEAIAHLNQIYVKPGDAITKFSTEVGTTGGGVGDLLLYDGFVHAATRQSDFGKWSTGKHAHFSVFKGSTLSEADKGWSDTARQVNPTNIIDALRKGLEYPAKFIGMRDTRETNMQPIPEEGVNPGIPQGCTPPSNPLDVGQGIAYAFCVLQTNVTNAINAEKQAFANTVIRGGVLFAGIGAMILGSVFLVRELTQ